MNWTIAQRTIRIEIWSGHFLFGQYKLMKAFSAECIKYSGMLLYIIAQESKRPIKGSRQLKK